MTVSMMLLVAAILCAAWAVVTSVLITVDLGKRGVKTPWALMRWYFFRNIRLYRAETLRTDGKVAPLFYSFVISINAAWVLAVLALWFS